MTEISPINSSTHITPAEAIDPQRSSSGPQATQADSAVDRVEISAAGRALSESQPDVGLRQEKIARIREQIAAGTYETEEKIAATADRLLDTLKKMIAK